MTTLPPDETPAQKYISFNLGVRAVPAERKVLLDLPQDVTGHLTVDQARNIGGLLFFAAADAAGLPRPDTIHLTDETGDAAQPASNSPQTDPTN